MARLCSATGSSVASSAADQNSVARCGSTGRGRRGWRRSVWPLLYPGGVPADDADRAGRGRSRSRVVPCCDSVDRAGQRFGEVKIRLGHEGMTRTAERLGVPSAVPATRLGMGCAVQHDHRVRTDDHPVLASTVVTGPLRVLIRATGVRVGRMRLRSGSPTAIRITGDNHGGAGWCGATGAVSGRVRRQPCRDRCPIAAVGQTGVDPKKRKTPARRGLELRVLGVGGTGIEPVLIAECFVSLTW